MAEKQYTRQAQEALNMARKIAAELKHPYVGQNISFGLKRVFTGCCRAGCLIRIKSMKNRWKKQWISLYHAPEAAKKERKHLEYSPRLRYILEESQNEAAQLASEKSRNRTSSAYNAQRMEIVWLPVCDDPDVNIQKTFFQDPSALRRELIRKSIWKIRRMGKLLAEL